MKPSAHVACLWAADIVVWAVKVMKTLRCRYIGLIFCYGHLLQGI